MKEQNINSNNVVQKEALKAPFNAVGKLCKLVENEGSIFVPNKE